jgi:hypothetical protein
MCGNGLGVRAEDSQPKAHWFESSLELFFLKTKGVNSGLKNRNMFKKNSDMVGKFRPWD